ncbi:hypothetical protein OPT61_g7310 [Boeremia exigua]|uniref:Uncharacterized protein n=1 Tax=Boeremia exigua TaxID=749465 RepID=A0ACC2I3R0_9PLEO|nr:hypothetical protein OPT61_g7310 [Boeremia exigua]
MPPKQLNGKGGRTVAEPSFARTAIQGLTSAENRSVVTSIGLFAVSLPRIRWRHDEKKTRDGEPTECECARLARSQGRMRDNRRATVDTLSVC